MKRYISLMLMLAFVMAVAVGCGGSPEDKLAKAQAAADDGDFEKALEICQDLLNDEDLSDELRAQVETLKEACEAGEGVGEAVENAGGLLGD
jgi:hypothetical protein